MKIGKQLAIIGNLNGCRAFANLYRAATDPRVASIEGEGCDDGRVFIHLRPGYRFDTNGNQPGPRGVTVGNAADVRRVMSRIIEG